MIIAIMSKTYSILSNHSLLSFILLCLMPIAAHAQDESHSADNYSKLSLSLDITQPVHSGYGVTALSNHTLSGIGISYLWGFNVTSHQLPLFLEVGPECRFVRSTEEIDYWEDNTLTQHDEVSTRLLTLSTPVNLTYFCQLTDALVLAPSAGLNLKANLLATKRSMGHSIDLFDQDAHRLQLGWNVGCGLTFDRYCLSLSYQGDFTSFMTEGRVSERFQSLSLSLGYFLR